MELKESAQNVTMHGFGRYFLTKNKLLKCIWLLISLCCSGILIWMIEPLVTYYSDFPTAVRQSTIVKPQMVFPALTICGLNDSYSLPKNTTEFSQNEDMARLSNLTASCLFNGDEPCSYPKDFKEILTIDRGLCTTFNPNGEKKQLRGGYYYGLNLILLLNSSKPTSGFFMEKMGLSDVVEVFPHHHEYFPFPLSSSYLISPGYLTRIEMKKEVTKRKPYPYKSNCSNGEEMDLIYPGKYTLANCQETCIARASNNCSHNEQYRNYYVPKYLKKPIAKTYEEFKCWLEMYAKMDHSGYKSCGCNLPCEEIKFSSTVSYSRWPATGSSVYLKEEIASALGINQSIISDDYLRQNFAKISVFYGDVSHTEVEEISSYSWYQLLSDVGGQMGIWIGASVFSILEIFYLSMQALHYVYAERSTNASPQPNV